MVRYRTFQLSCVPAAHHADPAVLVRGPAVLVRVTDDLARKPGGLAELRDDEQSKARQMLRRVRPVHDVLERREIRARREEHKAAVVYPRSRRDARRQRLHAQAGGLTGAGVVT